MPRHIIRLAAGLLAALALAAPALALDTWEPYPRGAAALELYATRWGQGNDLDAAKGWRADLLPAWGLDERTHAWLAVGLMADDGLAGGADFLGAGVFRTLRDGPFKLDVFAQLAAVGPGLAAASRQAGLEINVDEEGWGVYSRPIWEWVRDDDGAGGGVVARRLVWANGMVVQARPDLQFLIEWARESLDGWRSVENGSRNLYWAAGLNRVVSEDLELIMEARRWEPVGDEDPAWDFTIGVVAVW
ncbi:MAG: hypothetical protein JW819_03830 [Candidatus Krumholzibacteriota bacterium]|nr:hypothetical protein [Candidatus Krumholzibacteriota bacterium]